MSTHGATSSSESSKSRAGSLNLLGGALCLDFANTTSGLGSDHCLEHLHRYEHLLLWSQHVGSITEAEARRLRHTAERAPAAATRTLLRAKELRRAIYAVCTSTSRGRRPPAPALAALNREIAAAAGRRQLAAGDQHFAWEWVKQPGDLATVLRPVALSAADLLLTLDLRRLKQCPGEHCGWLFVDRTRSRTRRWCEMRVCGSRAKVRRFRRREGRRVGSSAKS